MSSLQREAMRRQLSGSVPPRQPFGDARGPLARRAQREYTPLAWSSYFESVRDVEIENSSFRVYLSGFSDADYGNKPLVLLLHGGGYSGLTWSLFAKHITRLCHCKVAAIDLRGHGSTTTDNEDDLSATTLATDVGNVCKKLLEDETDSEPPVVLIGHSMGGAVAVHCAVTCAELIPSLVGLIVIDVVEGTALDALQGMRSVLRSRPAEFRSLQHAIEWSVKSGQTRNHESARVSMPGQLKTRDGTPAADLCQPSAPSSPPTSSSASTASPDAIAELNEEDATTDEHVQAKSDEGTQMKPPTPPDSLIWRIDLMKSEPYWKGWFGGLSNLFLSAPAQAKMLLLAGIDRLDKTLTVGQMQGKFQMQVLPQCGHAVHEDVPDKVAEVVATFLIRNRLTQAKEDFQSTFPGC